MNNLAFALGPQQWAALTPAERDLLIQLRYKATDKAKENAKKRG